MTASKTPGLVVLVVYLFFIVCAQLFAVLNDHYWQFALIPLFGAPVWAVLPVIGLAAAIHAFNVFSLRFAPVRELDRELAGFVEPLLGVGPWPLAITSGVAEEWVFRGILMPSTGLWISGLIFGLLHWPGTRRLLPWTLWTVCMGWLLGALTLVFHSLWPAMLLHTLINGFSLSRFASRNGSDV